MVGVLFIFNTQHSRRLTLRKFIIHKGVVVKKTIYFLIIGIFIAAPYVVTAETYLKPGHPCYDIDPSNGGRDGHACWPKGEDPSVSVEASGDLGDGGAGALVGGGPSFDDGLMGAPGMSGAAITGSDSVVCGGFNNKVMAEINCLRRHLDTTAFRSNRRSSNDLGNYGCANRADRHQQVHCLRNILDGNGLAPGTQP